MSEENKKTILTDSEKNWIAIKKGDRNIAKKMIEHLAGTLLIDGELTRTERHRLASAMLYHAGDPEVFFVFGRTGLKATKAMEKISIWQAVTDRKKRLKSEGEKVVDVLRDVDDELGYEERKVRRAFDEIQRYIKDDKIMNGGIVGLLP